MTFTVLVAEDDEHDIVLLQTALERSGLNVRLLIARDGQEAVDYLAGGSLPKHPGAPARPDLFLLDITMPRLSGLEVLHWLSTRPQYRSLPVVILSFSNLDSVRRAAQLLGAAEFRVKPLSATGLTAMLQELYVRYLSPKVTRHTASSTELQPPPAP